MGKNKRRGRERTGNTLWDQNQFTGNGGGIIIYIWCSEHSMSPCVRFFAQIVHPLVPHCHWVVYLPIQIVRPNDIYGMINFMWHLALLSGNFFRRAPPLYELLWLRTIQGAKKNGICFMISITIKLNTKLLGIYLFRKVGSIVPPGIQKHFCTISGSRGKSQKMWGIRFEIMNNLISLNLIPPLFMHNFSSNEHFKLGLFIWPNSIFTVFYQFQSMLGSKRVSSLQ